MELSTFLENITLKHINNGKDAITFVECFEDCANLLQAGVDALNENGLGKHRFTKYLLKLLEKMLAAVEREKKKGKSSKKLTISDEAYSILSLLPHGTENAKPASQLTTLEPMTFAGKLRAAITLGYVETDSRKDTTHKHTHYWVTEKGAEFMAQPRVKVQAVEET